MGKISKAHARAAARAAQAKMSGEERARADESICEYVCALSESLGAQSVCIYSPLPDEADVSGAAARLIESGVSVYMPVMRGGDIKLVKAGAKTKFRAGDYGISEPVGEEFDPEAVRIDLCITPLVAFTSGGGRVGRGKGCYDRFFALCPCIKAGAAYACRYVADVQTQSHDVPMDIMITENGVIKAEDLK